MTPVSNSPAHQARQPGRRGFQHYQVADTGLVRPAAIVDDQHVTRPAPADRFQEHVHACPFGHIVLFFSERTDVHATTTGPARS